MLGGVGTSPVFADPISGNHTNTATHHSERLNITLAAIIDGLSDMPYKNRVSLRLPRLG